MKWRKKQMWKEPTLCLERCIFIVDLPQSGLVQPHASWRLRLSPNALEGLQSEWAALSSSRRDMTANMETDGLHNGAKCEQ